MSASGSDLFIGLRANALQALPALLIALLFLAPGAAATGPQDTQMSVEVMPDVCSLTSHLSGLRAGTTFIDLGAMPTGAVLLVQTAAEDAPACEVESVVPCDDLESPDYYLVTEDGLRCGVHTSQGALPECTSAQAEPKLPCLDGVEVPPLPPLDPSNICDYITASSAAGPCGIDITVDPCDFLRYTPGTCGNPPPDLCTAFSNTPGVCGNPPPPPPDLCKALSNTPGVCGNPPPELCDYITAESATGPCGIDISTNPCDYYSGTPGTCGNPLPDACDYITGAAVTGPCGTYVSTNPCDHYTAPGLCGPLPDYCDYITGVAVTGPCGIYVSTDPCDYYTAPGLCGPLPDYCQYLETLPTSLSGAQSIALPCGIEVSTDPCDHYADAPGTCGKPLPEPCDVLSPEFLSVNQAAGNRITEVEGPCGVIVTIPAFCDIASGVPGTCNNPLPNTDPCTEGVGIGDHCVVITPVCPDSSYSGPSAGPSAPCETGGLIAWVVGTALGAGTTVLRVVENVYEDLDEDGMGDEWERRMAGTLDTIVDKALDADLDGLSNLDEFRWNTDPFDPDTDADGLQDGPEAEYWDRPDPDNPSTLQSARLAVQDPDSKRDEDGDGVPNILDPDSDNDHLLDGQEYHGTFGPPTLLEAPDSEGGGTGDGLTDYQEVRDTDDDPSTGADGGYGTHPLDTDSDDDGIQDGAEATYWGNRWNVMHDCDGTSNNLRDADSDGDRLPDGAEIDQHGSDPADVDTDGDGMDDQFEVVRGFLVTTRDGTLDADGDRLTNLFEYGFEMPGYEVCRWGGYFGGLDPLDPDMDDDGLTDREEVDGTLNNRYTSNAYYLGRAGSTDARGEDTDEDGLSDNDELRIHGTNPNNADTDNDGLGDHAELFGHGTSPTDPDSDGDGMNDGDEVRRGINPTDADTDGDGASDGSDSNPGQEDFPPAYPGSTAYLVFREDGYIDVFIDDLNEKEADIVSITLAGTLTAVKDGASLGYDLHFNIEAARGTDGLWGARFALPPGVDRITQEELRLMVVDGSGNTWSSTQTFHNTLYIPDWQTSSPTDKEVGNWDSLIEHAPEVASGTPSSGASLGGADPVASTDALGSIDVEHPRVDLRPGADGALWYDPADQSAFTIYRIDMGQTPVPLEVPGFEVLNIGVLDDAWEWVDPEEEPELYTSMGWGAKWKSPSKLWGGLSKNVKDFTNSALDFSETGVKEAGYQSASFIFGADHPYAHGRQTGDFIGGFLLWGDIRDCAIRPFFVDPQTDAQRIIEVAIVTLSCTSAIVDIAQASPGAPAAIAANGAMGLIKAALKKLLVTGMHDLGVHVVDLIKLCKNDLSKCLAIAQIAKFITKETADNPGALDVFEVLGKEAAVGLGDDLFKSIAKMRGGFDEAGLGEAGFREFLQKANRQLDTLSPEQVLTKLDELYKLKVNRFNVATKDAAQMLSDVTSTFKAVDDSHLPAARMRLWLEEAVRAPKAGDQLEAAMMTKNVRDGWRVLDLDYKYGPTDARFVNPSYTKSVEGELDQWIGWSDAYGTMTRVEVTKEYLNVDKVAKVEKRMAYVATQAEDGAGVAKRMVYMVEEPPQLDFYIGADGKKGVYHLHKEYNVDFWIYVRSADQWYSYRHT